MKQRPKAKPITQRDARWFREQHSIAMDKNRELWSVIHEFATDLEKTSGLVGRLIADELTRRASKVGA